MLMLGGCSYHDRDFTVEDRDRGVLLAMEEELVKSDIARWNPSAGDSNKLGKIE